MEGGHGGQGGAGGTSTFLGISGGGSGGSGIVSKKVSFEKASGMIKIKGGDGGNGGNGGKGAYGYGGYGGFGGYTILTTEKPIQTANLPYVLLKGTGGVGGAPGNGLFPKTGSNGIATSDNLWYDINNQVLTTFYLYTNDTNDSGSFVLYKGN